MGNNKSDSFRERSKTSLTKQVRKVMQRSIRHGFDDNRLFLYDLFGLINKMNGNEKHSFNNNIRITSYGATILFDRLRASDSSISFIDLSRTDIDDMCMLSLGEYIKSSKYIESIFLSNTRITDKGIDTLAPYMDDKKTFKNLFLNGCHGITDTSVPSLIKIIESSDMEHIDITGTPITETTAFAISLAINSIKNGTNGLVINYKEITDEYMASICAGMKKFGIANLKKIDLNCNKISSKGASILFDTLRECRSVVSTLDISNNQFDDECIKPLGEFVQEARHLEYLFICDLGNKLTDKGVEILSEHLIGNTILKGLYLRSNRALTNASTPYLIKFAQRSCVSIIDVDYTSISNEKRKEIRELLKIPIDKREIPIQSNTKSAAKRSA